MKILFLICRILLGLMFVVFGANILHPFIPMPPTPPVGTPVGDFFGAFVPTGYMKIVGVFQLLGGLLLLVGGTAPLGLVLLGPVIVNILIYHVCLMGGAGIAPGLVAAVLEIVVIYAYRANFAGIFTTKAVPVTSAAL